MIYRQQQGLFHVFTAVVSVKRPWFAARTACQLLRTKLRLCWAHTATQQVRRVLWFTCLKTL